MGKSFSKIANPDKPVYQQAGLFPVTSERPKYDPFPKLYQGAEANEYQFIEVLKDAVAEGLIGCDLEFNDTRPTIIGIASRTKAIAVRWNEDLARVVVDQAQRRGVNIVGHSTIGAEKQELEKALGIKTPTSMYDCSLVAHHLCNADFTKLAGKEDGEEAGSLGLMNLWVVASLYTDLPMWKDCRGGLCEGPCPRHSVFDYCAVDSWASLASFYKLQDEMKSLNIPHSFYRDRMDLTNICIEMEKKGLSINREWVTEMDKKAQDYKESLFPFDMVNGKPVYREVNPKSRKQVLEYCKENNIHLEDTTKADVAKLLESTAKKEGFVAENVKLLCEQLEQAPEISKKLDVVYRLYQFKSSGKGMKSWFADKYFGKDGKIHPRFVSTGTCTGRLSSSRPNFTNIPARGWGAEAKKSIVPAEGCDLVDSDASQLELRVILFLAGYDVGSIGKDAFAWLVTQSEGYFAKAAVMAAMTERDISKSVSHGSDYLEGVSVLMPSDLAKPHIKAEIEYGARVLYTRKHKPRLTRDWDYRGGIVSFTGANLAERLFGDRTLANRKKALQITEDIYFEKFWAIREWQMKVLEMAEKGYVQSPVGRYLRLYGSPEDDAKMAVAFFGQGLGSDLIQAIMLRFHRELNAIPSLMVHDSLVFEVDKAWSDEKVKEFISLMYEETALIPGLKAPGKAKRGPNYGDLRPI